VFFNIVCFIVFYFFSVYMSVFSVSMLCCILMRIKIYICENELLNLDMCLNVRKSMCTRVISRI